MEIKMSFSIKFNDAELCDYLRVVTIRRNIGTTRTNNTVKSGNRAGQIFTSMTRDMASIEIDFKMKNNLIDKRRDLAAVLDVTKPVALILGDEPSKYYKAIPDGDITLTEQTFLGTGTLRFIVPDGLAHAVDTKTFEITENLLEGTSDEWEEFSFSGWTSGQLSYTLEELNLKQGDVLTYSSEIDNSKDKNNPSDMTTLLNFYDEDGKVISNIQGNLIKNGKSGLSVGTGKIPEKAVRFVVYKVYKKEANMQKQSASRKHMLTKGKQTVEWTDERIFHIVNKGTASARVNFNLEATRDVDSFALITEDDENNGQGQVLQIGDEDDPEITEQEPQTYLWKTKMNSKQESAWQDNIATPNYFSQSGESDKQSRVQGSISWTRSDGVRAKDYGGWNDGDNGYWHGPSITRFTKQDVQDFILYTRFHMRVTPLSLKGKKRTKKGGIMEFNVRDNDDNLICGVHFRDNDDKKEVIWINVYLADVKVWDGKVPRAKLMQDKRFAGGLTIQRNGNKFYIEIIKNRNGKQHWKKTLSMNNEAAARLAATRVDYWFAKYGGREQLAMDVTRSNFKILNTEDEADVPNHIDEEDEILIDGTESKVYINEEHRPEYFIVGSDFIEVPPGETDIYVVDDGALTGTASIEEVYV